jgi:hypothetical protein
MQPSHASIIGSFDRPGIGGTPLHKGWGTVRWRTQSIVDGGLSGSFCDCVAAAFVALAPFRLRASGPQ